jgi:hypothetical protein
LGTAIETKESLVAEKVTFFGAAAGRKLIFSVKKGNFFLLSILR